MALVNVHEPRKRGERQRSRASGHEWLLRGAGASTAGLLYFLAHPPNGLGWLGLVALCPLYLAVIGISLRRAFCLGWWSGVVATAAVCWWLPATLQVFLDDSSLSSWRLFLVFLAIQGVQLGLAMCCFRAVERWGVVRWLAFPIGVVLGELGTPQLLPSTLASVVHELTMLNQVADVSGRLGIVFLLSLANSVVAETALRLRSLATGKTMQSRTALWTPVGVSVSLFAVALTYSTIRERQLTALVRAANDSSVWMVNPVVDALIKRQRPSEIVKRYREATHRALNDKPAQMVVWGETALARPTRSAGLERTLRAVEAHRFSAETLVTGAVVEEDDSGRRRRFNSVVALDQSGRLCRECRYDKHRLLPLAEASAIDETWVPGVLSSSVFAEGRSGSPLRIGLEGALAVVICYEALFPSLMNNLVTRDSGVIINVASDLWFESDAPAAIQVAALKLRAIEQRRFVLRSAVGGPSVIVDPMGRIVVTKKKESLFGSFSWLSERTLYSRWGDWPWLLLPLGVMLRCATRLGFPQQKRRG